MRADNAVGWGYVETPSGSVFAQREEIQSDGNVGEEVEGGVGTISVGLDSQKVVAVVSEIIAGIVDGIVVDCALLCTSAERQTDIETAVADACYGV